MKLILHIGTEKTGSTSFQKWGGMNHEALVQSGVFYSQLLGRENHLKIYLWALAPGVADDGFAQVGLGSPGEQRIFRTTLPTQFAQEVQAARDKGCHTFLISNEHCHSRLKTAEDLERLKGFVSPHFDEIEILCSLRPQIDVAVSLTSTAARVGLNVGQQFFEKIDVQDKYYNYQDLVDRWVGAFGAENLTLLPFRRRPDMAAYLVKRLGLPGKSLQQPARINEALDIRAMALSNAISRGQRNGPEDQPKGNMPMVLDLMRRDQKLHPGLELAKKVQSRFTPINAKLARQWKSIRAVDLEPDWSRYDHPSNLDVLDQPCSFTEQLAELVSIYTQLLSLARAQEMAASAERARAQRNEDARDEFLRTARQHLLQVPKSSTLFPQRQAVEARLELIGPM
ncbi:hypothetical protein [Mesobacterium pallidum]|uniref:hypothetical protein n=1 Tax=Mesobacterium pallidum TaxID=2872037 RepID=UPI001EE258A0|nr:hypothetical protein [Mesobacterium pallidum]